jgi:hypothetical protein
MAPGYGQYNNYYDPVGSQANQPQSYAYQNQSAATSASQSTTAAYTAPQYPSYGAASYGSTQQYGSVTGGQQHDTRRNSGATSSATGARATGVNGHDSQASASRSNVTQQQETGAGSWGNPNYSTSYNTSLQPPSRTQSNTSPQYASAAPASTFGRLSYTTPSQQTQSGSSTYNQQSYGQQSAAQNYANSGTSDTSRQTYSSTQHHQTAAEPSRYASPLHAVQAQQHQQQQQSRASHGKQPSRSSNHQSSPVTNTRAPLQLNDNRQASASAEPVNTTVDPSQVYDFRAEREKKAEESRIAEERRKADEAVRQAGEAKRQAEEVRRQAEEMRVNEERRRAEQAKRKADEKTAAVKAAVKAEAERKKEEQRKARESKNAASTLASLATGSNIQESSSATPAANDEEAEMRAMFQKMREFNSKNPSMLAKLWEEERRTHAVQSQSPQPSVTAQPAAPAPKPSAPKKVLSSTPLSASTATPTQLSASRSTNTNAPTSTTTGATVGSTMHHQASEANHAEGNAPQSNTHLWPPGKKGLLAEIAARWLHSMNTHRVVTTSEILERLDTNPNYVQLCESLEAMGLRFERAAFARELLRGIPPAGPTNQMSPKVTEAAIMSANGTVAEAAGIAAPTVNNPKPKRPRATKAEMEQRRSLNLVNGINKQTKGKGTQSSNNGMVDYQMPSFTVPEDAPPGEFVHIMPEQMATSSAQPFGISPPQFSIDNDYSRQPSLSLQPERRSISGVQQGVPTPVGSAPNAQGIVRPPSPARPPADKEEAARKRGFGDLVDLTADNSDDEDLPPMKTVKPLQGSRPAANQQQHTQRLQQPSQPNQQHQQQPMHQAGQFDKFRLPSSAIPSPRNSGSPFPTPGISTNTQLYTQPNGAFGVAPTAVMSAATAPVPGPATATATLIKPATGPVPAPQPIKRRGPTNEHLQHERIKGKMVVEPIMRDRVARRSTYDSRTIARDILLATGRHPDMRPLNSHLNAMQKLLGDRGGMLDQSGNKSDLATIKWDILDPDPPKKTVLPAKAQLDDKDNADANGIKHSTESAGDDADDEEESRSTSQKPQFAREVSMRGSEFDLRANANVDANMNNKPLKIPKKRGRPRASAPTADAFPSVNSPMNTTSSRLSTTPRQVFSQPQSTPTMAPTGTPVGYAAFRQYDENGNEIKKKGRPLGWRKNVHSREAAGLTPKKSLSAKPKPAAPRPGSELQEPKYQVYRCHWLDCDAQLHSLEVLKKHVTKVHGRPEGEDEYRCKWRGCKLNTEATTPFKDISVWLAHVDKEHLQAVAWKLGDGPRGGLSGE